MTLSTIYLDVDDVCNRLTMWLMQRFGCPVGMEYSDYPAHVGYSIVDAINHLTGKSWTMETFWKAVPAEWWEECPVSAEFPWLLEISKELVGRSNVFFATAITSEPSSAAGKLAWIQRHAPSWMHRQFVIGPNKYLLARPDTLLIDDNTDQIERFRKHGGHGLLVPRPWNHSSQNLSDLEKFAA